MARRWRLARQLAGESLILGALGAAGGLIIGSWLIRLLPSLMVAPPGFRSFLVFQMDARVMLFTAVLTIVTTMLVGLSLMLGLFTQLGCWGAIGFLAMFYASMPPTTGLQVVGAEGAYLFVNKNLVELAAVVAVLSFKTGRIAGLDQLVRSRRRRESMGGVPVTVQE